jgi:hypothetical protein
MHGGTNPGAPKGRQNGSYKSGRWTEEVIEARRMIRALVRSARATVDEL